MIHDGSSVHGCARRPESTAAVRALVAICAAALMVAGCAGRQPVPSGAPAPPIDPTVDSAPDGAPTPQPPTDPATAPRGRGDASTPTLALLRQSDRSAAAGDLATAVAYVERAIRLDPQDGNLWLRLARLQLEAGQPAAAEQLAHKALSLAGDRVAQQRDAWLLVADAREAQGDAGGAAEIRERWRTYRG